MQSFSITDPVALLAIGLALFSGGMLKGAIGMGAPVVAIPVMASFFDVRLAVVIMVIPNLITNLWQLWIYRAHRLTGGLPVIFAIAGGLGAFIGSILLAQVAANMLKLVVALAVLAYVALRLNRPDFAIGLGIGAKLAAPMGFLAGVLQGAAGMSAPVSASFLNALKLPREVFIVTISMLFVCMSVVQIPMLIGLHVMTSDRALLGAFALLPLLAGMPIEAWMARRISAAVFDRITIVVLVALAIKLLADAVEIDLLIGF